MCFSLAAIGQKMTHAPLLSRLHTHTFPPTRFAHGPKILTSILCWYPAQGLLRQLISLIIFCITNMLYVGTVTPEILHVVKLDLDIVPHYKTGPHVWVGATLKPFTFSCYCALVLICN